MARCDQGYLCDVCGEEVSEIENSDLYLRYVLGEVKAGELLSAPERHLRCNPTVAQFIVDDLFEPMTATGAFAKENLDRDFVALEEERTTRAWRRLQEVRSLGITLSEYPLED